VIPIGAMRAGATELPSGFGTYAGDPVKWLRDMPVIGRAAHVADCSDVLAEHEAVSFRRPKRHLPSMPRFVGGRLSDIGSCF